MSRVVLISCVSRKLNHRAKARDIYVSDLFRKSLAYAQRLQPDAVYILSAKYGLVHPDDELEPYDLTLTFMPINAARAWADGVLRSLRERTDVGGDHFILLAGEKYRRFLVPHLRSVEVPMLGLGIGQQLHFLGRRLSE